MVSLIEIVNRSELDLVGYNDQLLNKLYVINAQLLSKVHRFQADPGVYIHAEIPPRGQYGGYSITREGKLNPLFEPPKEFTYNSISSQWLTALQEHTPPPRTEYVDQTLTINGEMIPDIRSWKSHTSDEIGRHDPHRKFGWKAISSQEAETVYQHVRDLHLWQEHFYKKGLLPSADMLRMIRMTYLHDVGEAKNGDWSVLRGVKTQKHEEQEEADFIEVIDQYTGSLLNAEEAEECVSLYHEYNNGKTPEALAVAVTDRFCGSLVHMHSQLDLNVKHLRISYQRVMEKYERLTQLLIPGFNPQRWYNEMMRYFIPSSNWIRFASLSEELQKEFVMEYE